MRLRLLPYIHTHDGRRALAFLAIVGGCMVFTLVIAINTYMLRNNAGFLFWLAMAAHAQVFLGMTALGWFAGRRIEVSAGKSGLMIDDKTEGESGPEL